MKPFLLFSRGDSDPDFLYATRFPVGESVYIRFGDGDDLLIAPRLELDRASGTARVKAVAGRDELGWAETGPQNSWAWPAARALRDRGVEEVRVSAGLPAGIYEDLRGLGIRPEIDPTLLVAERRRKSGEEAQYIHSAQRAAEAACAEIIAQLAVAEIRDGMLWMDDRPLTSERLIATGVGVLEAIGYQTLEMIVAGSPGSAMPHYRGEGQLRAALPVIIDIFPSGRTSHYHGDLTRTVIAGPIEDRFQRMHEAVAAALDRSTAMIRAGVNGRDVHRAACQVLVEAGYGTTTAGLEGRTDGPIMHHSLGHGVGLAVHELPDLRDRDGELAAGDVVTVEPGLYQMGLGGIRIEDLGLVTAEGFRNFSSLPRGLDPRAYL